MADEGTIGEGAAPGGGFGLNGMGEMPSIEAIFEMIDKASGISDEEKAQIKEDVVKFRTEGPDFGAPTAAAAVAGGIFAPHNLLFIALVLLIAIVLGFFVYKLIKTEKDKEKSKELKRLAKENKLKKKGKNL